MNENKTIKTAENSFKTNNNSNNNVVECDHMRTNFKVPQMFTEEQKEILKWTIENYIFLARNKNITYTSLAARIKESYNLNNPQNRQAYNICILASQYLCL